MSFRSAASNLYKLQAKTTCLLSDTGQGASVVCQPWWVLPTFVLGPAGSCVHTSAALLCFLPAAWAQLPASGDLSSCKLRSCYKAASPLTPLHPFPSYSAGKSGSYLASVQLSTSWKLHQHHRLEERGRSNTDLALA